jgi:ZIP family zinc transporter
MQSFPLMLAIASLTAFFTWLGAPLAEWIDAPQYVVNAALQLAAGILTAIVGFSLLPVAIQSLSALWVMVSFFSGGSLFLVFEQLAENSIKARDTGEAPQSIGLYLGILLDLVVDGAAIGIGATVDFATGLLLAIGVGVHSAPLVFVMIATAKRQGLAPARRRLLALIAALAVLAGALIGFLALRNQSQELRTLLIAATAGFLLTTVTQSMTPEAQRDAPTNVSGYFYIGGLALAALLALMYG